MSGSDALNFYKPKTPAQWLIFLAAIGLTLTSPVGTRAFLKELNKHILKSQHDKNIKYESVQLSRALYGLKKRRMIKIRKIGDKTIIELTEKGKRRKLKYDVEHIKIPKQDKWDGKWRMIMFDIPESEKFAREALREKLKNLGFAQFQKSIWIYPYPCENEIDFVTEFFSIAKHVNLITVKIDDDRPLRAEFNL
ncbi:MAG: hypothetical protein A3I33_01330 [Candidatus Colwellbacteria bacterium RIFCSPLOWO2_02_FULL_45_11]|uniref:Transcriptional repressor PaaX-like central Cas2-like domain-containing protein n=1 Tax=Candidatus Colwellbacteria bacterium RIFCSPLOWO2_02_FULL_45_11 TaxID=1797692 RepID=A0A1G1Z8R4_9BACT|nr:MAG: hypothetical protein A3I33_01330 [Candidatus Colwellbacteria bacterium RIFCSPLOWO2_02_FULL_45_11]